MSRNLREDTITIIVTIAPVFIVMLMTKPALRQAIAMRVTHAGKTFCDTQADFWQDYALRFAQAYNKARM